MGCMWRGVRLLHPDAWSTDSSDFRPGGNQGGPGPSTRSVGPDGSLNAWIVQFPQIGVLAVRFREGTLMRFSARQTDSVVLLETGARIMCSVGRLKGCYRSIKPRDCRGCTVGSPRALKHLSNNQTSQDGNPNSRYSRYIVFEVCT